MAVPKHGIRYNIVDAYVDAKKAYDRLGILDLLGSLRPLNPNKGWDADGNISISEASRVIGHLAAIQEKFVGAVSLCDLLNARDICDRMMEMGGILVTDGRRIENRVCAGIYAAKALGWIKPGGMGTYGMNCWFYDAGSVMRATVRRSAAMDQRTGIHSMRGQMHVSACQV